MGKPTAFNYTEHEKLKTENEQLRTQLDAAVEDITVAHDKGRCAVCKYKRNDGGACNKWPDRSCFQWRGAEWSE